MKAPIGLNIGCRTPEEIAVSIVAQLIARRRNASIKRERKNANDTGDTESDRLAAYPENHVRVPRPRTSPARLD